MTVKNFEKFMIGTAQWGSSYGTYNKTGRCNNYEVNNILQFMRDNNVADIDTSLLYGDAHGRLNSSACVDMRIYSKIRIDIDDLCSQSIANVADYPLQLNNIYGLSIHNADIVQDNKFERAVDHLHQIKEFFNIPKIGISIYDTVQLEKLYQTWCPDIIQIPLNFFNDSFLISGALEFIQSKGTEIHVRSLFCQGLLLQELGEVRLSNSKNKRIFERYCNWCDDEGLTKLEACLSLMKSLPIIDKFILGFDNSEQLRETATAYDASKPLKNIPSFNAPIDLYDPRYWG